MNYDELIQDLELNHEYCPKEIILQAAAAIKELIEQRDLAMADARYFEKQRDELARKLANIINYDEGDIDWRSENEV